ncbi:DUF3465 domain-containing protein [Psychrobacter sp. I-STPA6b]|uniref:DUF3465 domain-containing protein n=1 Tax=Psychrobacter sp. I-STPA6b TaxID=2585718 RepID=UPI001D0CA110|nr:DUF3465 domain-containing protein [Psychrobacter sp. I-STPA6b]
MNKKQATSLFIIFAFFLSSSIGCEEQSMNMDIFEFTSDEVVESIAIDSQVQEEKANHSVIKKVLSNNNSEHKIEPVSCHNHDIVTYFAQADSDKKVKVCGKVIELLADENHGNHHQRFIIELDGVAPKHHVLITHNIELAPRLDNLSIGDTVMVYGIYKYNMQGGIIYKTHHDPNNHHQCGWIEFNSRRYQ